MQFYLTKDMGDQPTDNTLKLIMGEEVMFVPKDEGNRHYQMYLAWKDLGNVATLEPAPAGGV